MRAVRATFGAELSPHTRATYQLRVIQYAGFGHFHNKLQRLVGKPPELVYAVDGANITINCTITSYDKSKMALKPSFQVDDKSVSEMCLGRAPPFNPLICAEMHPNIQVRVGAHTPAAA